jgi:hypothetical protein
MILKAISIRQPWAWAIVTGEKDVENRSSHFPQRYRGPVLIHASKGSDPDDWEWMRRKYRITAPDDLPRGGFVGIAEIVDVVTRSRSRWFNGEIGLVLANARELPFKPWKGQVGLQASSANGFHR